MTKIVGVRFRHAGRVYYFEPGDFEITPGMNVIVTTARGMEYGTAVSSVREIEDDKAPQGLRPIQRIATEEDTERALSNREKEREAMAVCKEKIRSHGLEMKLIDAEYTFDNNKILFYFTADGRVDFRELVKDLAGIFRTRIELRQIGVRDETKILGGIGICGRPLCCHSYLTDFIPVSIRMAKEQNLSLNPTKISGVCGRLMCCLKNEEATYQYLNSRLPRPGEYVTTPGGLRGEVSEINVLRQRVKVLVDMDGDKDLQEYDVEELKFRSRRNRDAQNADNAEGSTEMDGQDNSRPDSGQDGRRQDHGKQGNPRNRRDGQRGEDGGKKRGFQKRGQDGGDTGVRKGRGQGEYTPRNGENAPRSVENTPRSGENAPRSGENPNPRSEHSAAADGSAEKRRPRRRHHSKPNGTAGNANGTAGNGAGTDAGRPAAGTAGEKRQADNE